MSNITDSEKLRSSLSDESIREALCTFGALLFSDRDASLSAEERRRAQRRANRIYLSLCSDRERNSYEGAKREAIEARLEREELAVKKEVREAEKNCLYVQSFYARVVLRIIAFIALALCMTLGLFLAYKLGEQGVAQYYFPLGRTVSFWC
jgi:hypothetical protein